MYGLRMPPEKTAERAFEYLVEYPCEFQIKVIGINEGSFADDIAATVSSVCEVREGLVYDDKDAFIGMLEIEGQEWFEGLISFCPGGRTSPQRIVSRELKGNHDRVKLSTAPYTLVCRAYSVTLKT